MGGPEGTEKPLQGRWAIEGGVLLGAPGLGPTRMGASVEASRRIPFGAHKLTLDKLSLNDHWTFDVGLGLQSLGWSEWRPRALAASVRAGLGYNILDIMDLGLSFRGGYADVTNGSESARGLTWAAGLRFVTTVAPYSVIVEGGFLSMPALPGEPKGTGPYGLLSGAYVF